MQGYKCCLEEIKPHRRRTGRDWFWNRRSRSKGELLEQREIFGFHNQGSEVGCSL